MCFGDNNDAAAAAQRAEDARQRQISLTSSSINRAFDSPAREAQLQDYLSATREYYGQQLEKQATIAGQNNRFALARAGQTGGSVDADAGTRLSNEYNDASLLADQKAQAAYQGLKASDDQARQSLLALATSGASITNAQVQANNAFASSLATSRQQVASQGLGDLFQGFADANKQSLDAAERRRALKDYSGGIYAPSGSSGGFSTGRGGF